MLPPIFQTLKASTDVKAIVGTNPPRIYRFGDAPQVAPGSTPQPYVTWFLVAGVPENNLSDPPPVDRDTVQIDCWHSRDADCVLLALAVRAAMEQVCYMTGVIINLRDPETKLYRIGMEFDVFNAH
jgi:hypothetical protein